MPLHRPSGQHLPAARAAADGADAAAEGAAIASTSATRSPASQRPHATADAGDAGADCRCRSRR